MDERKKKRIKILAAVIFMVAAGICYSCGRNQDSGVPGDGIFLSGGQSGLSLLEAGTTSAAGIAPADGIVPESGAAAEADAVSGEGAGAADSAAAQSTSAPTVYVHICCAVERPGVYQVEEGSRVFQVVEEAGGFLEEAAPDYLNMADAVSDGMKLVVPYADELEAGQAYGETGQAAAGVFASGPAKININTADKAALMTLKGIGESRAEDIIRYREQNGGFQKIEDIMNVSGIKDASFEKIRDDITV